MMTTQLATQSNKPTKMDWLVILAAASCLIYNAYHMFNWLYEMHATPNSMNIKATLMGLAGVGLALLEIPATVMLVNAIRLKDSPLLIIFYIAFIGIICFMTVKAGMASQTSIYDHRENVMQAETQKIDNLGTRIEAAQAKRDAAYALAGTYGDAMSKTMRAAADAKFAEEKAKISDQRADMTASKTSKVSEGTDETMIILFPLLLSLGGVIATAYSLLHVTGKLRIAAMSMENKVLQKWSTKQIEDQKHELTGSPIAGVIGKAEGTENAQQAPVQSTKPEAPAQNSQNRRGDNVNKAPSPAITTKQENYTQNVNGFIVKRTNNPDGTMQYDVTRPDGTKYPTLHVPMANEQQYMRENPNSNITKSLQSLSKAIRDAKAENEQKKDNQPDITLTSPSHHPEKPLKNQPSGDLGAMRGRSAGDNGAINEPAKNDEKAPKTAEISAFSSEFNAVKEADGVGQKKLALLNVIRKIASNNANNGMKFSKAACKGKGLGDNNLSEVFELATEEGILQKGKPYRIVASKKKAA